MFSSAMLRAMERLIPHFSIILVITAVAVFLVGCGGNPPMIQSSSMGTINVSMSDPPSCVAASSTPTVPVGGTAAPSGNFTSVFVTIRSIQAHTSATADNTSSGWQELAPQLFSAPMQVDLLHLPANGQCLLVQLGSTSLPAGDYQQIRLILLANAAPSGPSPSSDNNACFKQLGGDVFNCVVDSSGTRTLDLSSEANTGLKIPPGQIMGGPIHVAAGQSVDLNIDFNTCASILMEGNGDFRLKPALTAGVVSTNMTGISGQIVDSVTSQPIAGASTGPGTIQGTITAINGTTGATIDADISALQSVTVSSTSHTFTVPLFANSKAADVKVTSSTSCPTGAPKGAFCGSYTLIVPASNPTVGTFSAAKTTITAPATGDVLYTVEADASNPTSDAAMCSPSSQTTSKDGAAMPLKVTAGATTTAAELDFTGCS